MKAKIFVFLVAALFVGTTFAGASFIAKEGTANNADPEPCPSGQEGTRGSWFRYKSEIRRWKHVDVGETVEFEFDISWSGRDGEMRTPVTIELLLEEPDDNTILQTKVLTQRPRILTQIFTWNDISHTFDEEGTYPVRLRVYDNASAYDEGADEKPYDKINRVVLTTYVGNVESNTRSMNFLSKINLFMSRFQLITRLNKK